MQAHTGAQALALVVQMAEHGAPVKYAHVQTLVDRFMEAGDPEGLLTVLAHARHWVRSPRPRWPRRHEAAPEH